MTAELFEGHYVWHPAADDRVLAGVCVEVRAGRYRYAYEALAETRSDFGLRAHRSLVLASEAADTDLVERWLAEEPTPEAALLWARVAVQRALRAADAHGGRTEVHDGRAEALERIALTACDRAAALAPKDPTPWVAKLAMARLHRRLHRLRDPAPQGLLTAPPGPWRLFAHILSLDPWHREGHHRFLSFFFARYGGSVNAAWDVAAFLGQRAPVDSALRLLPLVALVESYDPTRLLADRVWEQPQWRSTALAIHRNWLPSVAGYRFTPVLDLAYLAHALVMARCESEARVTLLAMGPYASRMPWSAFGDPVEQLSRARRACGLPAPGAA
ncbi:hypothetical protein LK07_04990 [Streptomyces pluripotens]|uniref:Uncharacterized protein n=1 Tax=Streptomyces pluripotens TaxID=1355015 RepID=A0A221NU69_9ACTN|nr:MULTISPECIES: hypothetical protein [Streptomyces]ARP69223.1 hypothetical protein LK06_003905 [Streptomyces pluripotens]ASN23484.1 hypothetical protein LK07_04990 [Streptomyces pluripotens]KIE28472.1 hypothetical protein LK08_03750 [Streptomyces sp. MUSC 125]MCH0555170.1 hypothetical protein [Streptomyces sp. MUM 16J]